MANLLGLTLFLVLGVLPSAAAQGKDGEGPLMPLARTVLERYERIQKALAVDSMTGVSDSASAIVQAVRADGSHTFPAQVAEDAAALAGSVNLRTARSAFKSLSDSLIAWLETNRVHSSGYQEAYCPMADASWLQKGESINNPYHGAAMRGCGVFERRF